MLSQLASVFSSQGVVLPDTEQVAFPVRERQAEPACDHKNNCKCFAPVFDQASAKLELSKQAVKAAEEAGRQEAAAKRGGESSEAAGSKAASKGRGKAPDELTPEEEKMVKKLEERDREVRRHEQAHIASAGGNARGGAKYEYQVGPDNKQYAVGGHVDIDVSAVSGNPQATLQKAMAVQRAASAPADPSGADRAVAAAAASMAREAAREIADKRGNGPQSAAGGKSDAASAASEARRNPYAQSRIPTGATVNAYA